MARRKPRSLPKPAAETNELKAELKESEALLRAQFTNSPDIVMVLDRRLRYVKINRAMFGPASAEELIGKDAIGVLPARVQKYVKKRVNACFETGKPQEFEHEVGDGKWVLARVVRLPGVGKASQVMVISTDITERRAAEQKLAESEEKYRSLVDESLQGIVIATGPVPRLVYANPALARMTGYTVRELTSFSPENIQNLIHPDDREIFFSRFRARLAGKRVISNYMFRAIRKDGKTIWFELSSAPIAYMGQPAVQATFIDVTEHHVAEDAIKESEARFRKVFEYGPLGMLLSTLDYHLIAANPAACKIFGYREQELKKLTFRDITHPDDRERDVESLQKLSAGKISFYNVEKRYMRKDGKTIWGKLNVSTIRDPEGRPAYHLVMVEDITPHKEADLALKQSQHRLQDILDFLPDATFVLGLDGRITVWNKAMEQMTGKKASWMLGKANHEYAIPFYGERKPGVAELMLKPNPKLERTYPSFIREGDRVAAEIFVPKLRGKPAYLWMVAKQLCGPDGKTSGVIESVRNVTQQKKAENELRREKDKVEELSMMKERFMADMAHELKTPLSVILLNVEMMWKMDPSIRRDDMRKCLGLLWRNARRMNTSLDQMMQLTRLESIDIRRERFCLKRMMRFVFDEYVPLARSKGIGFDMRGPDLEMDGNPHLLAVVVSNLISNAVKFTAKGAVRIGWKRTDSKVVIWVRDTGVGIKPENQAKIFRMFFKERYDAPGSGIGLALSAELVGRMGGTMEFRSREGRGSAFRITIPQVVNK